MGHFEAELKRAPLSADIPSTKGIIAVKLLRDISVLTIALAGGIALPLSVSSLSAAGSGMTPGKWRSSTKITEMTIPGLPPQVAQMMKGRMGQGYSVETCITPEQASRPPSEALGARKDSDCKYESFSFSGGRLNAVMVCNVKGQGQMRSIVNGSVSGSGYTMTTDTTINNSRTGAMKVKGTVTGTRIGDC
jgi:hypothetical protein